MSGAQSTSNSFASNSTPAPLGRKVHLRRTHKKSHLGCRTCKTRRIKCDEHIPVCTQCKRAKLECPYQSYTPEQILEHETKRAQAAAAAAAAAAAVATESPLIPADLTAKHLQEKELQKQNQANQTNLTEPQNHSQLKSNQQKPYNLSFPANESSLLTNSKGNSEKIYMLANHLPQTHPSHPGLLLQGSSDAPSGGNIVTATAPSLPHPFLGHSTALSASDSLHNSVSPMGYTDGTTSIITELVLPPAYSIFINGIPRVDRINEITNLRRRNLLNTVNLVRSGFETDYMRKAYSNWLSNTLALAFHFDCLYHAFMAFSYGFQHLKTKQNHFLICKEQHRILSLKAFQSEFDNVSPRNTDALLGTSLVLYWDAMYQEDKIYNYIGMCRGLGAILEAIQTQASVTQTSICITESLAQAIKHIIFPRYSYHFLQEIRSQLVSLEPLISSQARPEIYEEYTILLEYLERIYGFVSSYELSAKENGIYEPSTLFSYMKEWISKFPCLAFSLDLLSFDDASIVLYTYYDTISHALDALFPEARYLFQFSFIGPIDLLAIEQVVQLATNQGILEVLKYPLRITSFFKKRDAKLNEIFHAADPLLLAPHDLPLHELRHLDLVRENPVFTFTRDFDFEPHMPVLAPGAAPFINPLLSTKAITEALAERGKARTSDRLFQHEFPKPFSSSSTSLSQFAASNYSSISVNLPAPPAQFSNSATSSLPTGGQSLHTYSPQSHHFTSPSTSSFTEEGTAHHDDTIKPQTATDLPFPSLDLNSNATTNSVAGLGISNVNLPSDQSTTRILPNPSAAKSFSTEIPANPTPLNPDASEPLNTTKLPPLCSLSMGSFKKYFNDRLGIIDYFSCNSGYM